MVGGSIQPRQARLCSALTAGAFAAAAMLPVTPGAVYAQPAGARRAIAAKGSAGKIRSNRLAIGAVEGLEIADAG